MGLFGFSKDKNKIKLTKEKHVITDDAAGFEYEIDTSFKQIRSNAMEVEALAVYASEGRENKHSDVPCVMVLTDSGIYEAIETYNEKGLSEGMKPANGMFLYKTLTEYYGDQLYYYAFEKDNKNSKEKLGLCMEYPKEYVGTDDEKVLMKVLDEVAESFRMI